MKSDKIFINKDTDFLCSEHGSFNTHVECDLNKEKHQNDAYFSFDICEESKSICIEKEKNEIMRVLKVKVELKNLCPNRALAYVVQIISCKDNKVIVQKGNTVFTGNCECFSNKIVEEEVFALPLRLCKKSETMYVNIISNYIANDL